MALFVVNSQSRPEVIERTSDAQPGFRAFRFIGTVDGAMWRPGPLDANPSRHPTPSHHSRYLRGPLRHDVSSNPRPVRPRRTGN